MSEWEEVKLSEVSKIVGGTPSRKIQRGSIAPGGHGFTTHQWSYCLHVRQREYKGGGDQALGMEILYCSYYTMLRQF